jgi:hypothetical protein
VPSELQRVAQQLLATLDEIPRVVAYLHDSARRYRESAGWIGSMSNNQSARTAATQLDEAARRCEEAAHYLLQAHARGRSWVEQMVSGVRTAEPTGGSPSPRPVGSGGSPPSADRRQNDDQDKPEAKKSAKPPGAGDNDSPKGAAPPGRRITDEDGYRLQQELPDREQSRLSRPKTRGTWVDENGDKEDLVSGEHDEWFQKVTDFLRERGIPPRDDAGIMSPSHVETKFAMRMRLRGLKHETIMVNKLPCKGQFGCEELLRDILPPGSTLTVFGPKGFKETYPLPTDE